MERDPLTYPWFMERRYLTLITVLVFVILSAIASFVGYQHHTINTEKVLKEDRSTTNLLSLLLDEHLKKIVIIMEAYSNRPFLLPGVGEKIFVGTQGLLPVMFFFEFWFILFDF